MRKIVLLLACMLVGSAFQVNAQMTTRVVRDSLNIPWDLVYGPDDWIYFTQKNGYICRLDPVSRQIDTLYHEANTYSSGEGGMLGLALHPDFPTQPYIYVAYNYQQSGTKERVVRYTYASNSLSSPLTLIENIAGAGIHNGCRLVIIGDKLFISTGDAANQALPQNVNSVNGKILRLDLDGSIPSDNPIPGNPAWSWGHRNAQGLVYANGNIYSSEHGPSTDDEVNMIQKGRNYGWPNVHGFCNTPSEITFCADSNVVEPLMAWTPTIAVCGIDYYNHPMFPAWQNSLLMCTLAGQDLYQLKLNSTFDSVVGSTVLISNTFGRLRDVCVAPDGKVYVSTSNSGSTNKIIEIYDPSAPTSASNIETSSEITIYPNPAGDYTVIKLPETLGRVSMPYTIVNAEGKRVATGTLTANNATISTKALTAGLYTITISGERGNTYKGKIMKQ